MSPELALKALLGKTLTSVEGATAGSDEVIFDTADQRFRMWHCQDCCESVSIHSIKGDVQKILGSPITSALEECPTEPCEGAESHTWTLFTIRTKKGKFEIKWLGKSNGYYSEGVSFDQIK